MYLFSISFREANISLDILANYRYLFKMANVFTFSGSGNSFMLAET